MIDATGITLWRREPFEKKGALLNFEDDELVSLNRTMQSILDSLPLLARSSATVLITGESGTGKELIARRLHEAGQRHPRKFVAINCAAVPEALLESELFGFEKGSFTGASSCQKGLFREADGGTLFLDEISDMPLSLQAKLLRVLQEKAVRPLGNTETKDVDFRLVAATNRDLHHALRQKQFREDLFYRLNVIPLEIPALRDRKEDIPNLVRYFLKTFALRDEIEIPLLGPEVLEELTRRRWKGNIRELENLIERLVVLNGHKGTISLSDLPQEINEALPHENGTSTGQSLPTVETVIKDYILHVLNQVGRHRGKASKILGLSPRTLHRKLKAYSQH